MHQALILWQSTVPKFEQNASSLAVSMPVMEESAIEKPPVLDDFPM
jgi:hypothetical protein